MKDNFKDILDFKEDNAADIIVTGNMYINDIEDGYEETAVKIIPNPTWNCQSCIVGGIYDMESDLIAELFTKAVQLCLKPLIMIDINKLSIQNIRDLFKSDKEFKENVILNAPYKSTSGNDMVIMIIKSELFRPKK